MSAPPSRVVSVITATSAGRAGFLRAAAGSLRKQDLPAGWEIQWLVQEDDVDSSSRSVIRAVPFGDYRASGEQLGVAATRNLALARADGEVCQVLDDDDLLLPGALAAALTRVTGSSSIGWFTGQAYDLLPDGTLMTYPPELPFGHVKKGLVNAVAQTLGRYPVHCAGLALRTDLLRAVGGWSALPRSEDVAMFAAASELYAGYFDPSFTWLYRQWPGQVVRTKRWQDWLPVTDQAVRQRITAVRELSIEQATDSARLSVPGSLITQKEHVAIEEDL